MFRCMIFRIVPQTQYTPDGRGILELELDIIDQNAGRTLTRKRQIGFDDLEVVGVAEIVAEELFHNVVDALKEMREEYRESGLNKKGQQPGKGRRKWQTSTT